jgi:hypothetical protein
LSIELLAGLDKKLSMDGKTIFREKKKRRGSWGVLGF